MRDVVLVTRAEFAKAEENFRAAGGLDVRPVSSEENAIAGAVRAARCRAVVLGVDAYRGPLYEALGQTGGDAGSLIARFGVGCDGIDRLLARQHRIAIINTPGALDQSVAEHTIWLLGDLARRVTAGDRALRAGQFAADAGVEVRGWTLGLLGFGAIARRVASIAHFGFGMRVVAADCRSAEEVARRHNRTIEELNREWGLEWYTIDIEAVLRQADIVSVHLPLTTATRHFMDAARLATMKPGALLINTARGPLVDELALYDVLASGRLSAAALDVYETEPYAPIQLDKDLRTLENVVLTPHAASNTREANRRMAEMCLANVTAFLSGRLDGLTRVDGSTMGMTPPAMRDNTPGKGNIDMSTVQRK